MRKQVSLDDKYALNVTRAYMTGIEALVRLPILQHQRDLERGLNTAGFVSGYRGSPLGGLDQAMWKAKPFLDAHNIVFQPGLNEDLAATSVWGSQQVNLFPGARHDGVFSLWYGKGPGVDRSMDAIRHANAFGTSRHGGVLAVAGDDHAAKSSSLPHQSEHMFIGASIPVLNPANVQEVLDLGIYGWELSRYCGAWVALKAITENMDSAISAEVDPSRVNIVTPQNFDMPEDGVHGRWPDTSLEQELRLNKYKIYAAREFARVNQLNRVVVDSSKPRLGIITTGKAYLDVMQALEDLGIDERKANSIGLRVFKAGMSWPLEPIATHEFAKGLEEILVVEEKRSIIEDQLTGQLYNWLVDERPVVVGEFDEKGRDLLPNLSELTPAMVARAIAGRLSRFYADADIARRLAFYDRKEKVLAEPRKSAQRTPHYCSGCPHSASTQLPEGSRALGGIGCHYMGTWETGSRRAETFTHMGGEGVTWVGQAPFTDTPHVFQNLGDGTYFHSGILAIRQTVAAGVNITYKLLYNDAVAMTGGQPLDGALPVDQLVTQLRGEGVQRIALVSDHPQQLSHIKKFSGLTIDHRDRLITIEKELRETPGTTVLVYVQTCAAELRRRRKKGLAPDPAHRVVINAEVCEGCGDCGTASNCLSVIPLETELGRKRQIDQSACNKDFSCLKGFCPSFVTVEGASLAKPVGIQTSPNVDRLPRPPVADISDQPWNTVVTGVGGTGVLTVAALMAMAAHIEGKGCATMNQTGLAQKFGAVVSHVRVGKTQAAIHAVRIPAGDADLLLGCDLVVAASNEAIAKVNVDRTHAVINESTTATAEFLIDPDAAIPVDEMKSLISSEAGESKVSFVAATELAKNLLGDSIAGNLFLLGFAAQKGLLPVSLDSLLAAIRLNDVAVAFNVNAFNWGRLAAVNDPQLEEVLGQDGVADVLAAQVFQPLTDVDDIIRDRSQRLARYQSGNYAARYETLVNQARQLEREKVPGEGEVLTRAVARALYKLMAYKDEYEVARLYSDGSFKQQLSRIFDDGDEGKGLFKKGFFKKGLFKKSPKIRFHLAAPMLARKDEETGLPVKRQFAGFMFWLFRMLAAFKFLRGTRFDPFGYSSERRLERRMIAEYEALLDLLTRHLNGQNYGMAVQLAELPMSVRGFGHVKVGNYERAELKKRSLLETFKGERVPVVDAG